jgi:hypothetical protein
MKLWFIFVLLVSNVADAAPKITLRYSPIFDWWCSRQTGIEITNTEQDRLISKFEDLQAEWNKVGPTFLAKTESLFKKTFLQNEMIATVFLCKKTPSLSMPLLINGNWFVDDALMQPTERVADIIFHELIHTYLADNFPNIWTSPFITKYQNENSGVLSHLHLNALQKKVYLELGLKKRVDDLIRFDSESYKNDYKRAWDIVNAEGEDTLLSELE